MTVRSLFFNSATKASISKKIPIFALQNKESKIRTIPLIISDLKQAVV